MKNKKTMNKRVLRILWYFLIGQGFNMAIRIITLIPDIMLLSDTNSLHSNAYLSEGWESGLTKINVIIFMIVLNESIGLIYWLKKLKELGEERVKRVATIIILSGLMAIPIVSFFLVMDFSPEAKEFAIRYQQMIQETKEKEKAYRQHLNQLPDDVQLQALGAYVLTLDEGETFVSYLNLSEDLFGDELASLHLNQEENAVLTYFKTINPTMSTQQQHALAIALYEDNEQTFMTLLTEPFEESPSLVKNPLCMHILQFELKYFDDLIVRLVRQEIDTKLFAQSLEGIVYRLEQAKAFPEINRGDILFLELHQSFYTQYLNRATTDSTRLRKEFTHFMSEYGYSYASLNPYEKITHYLSGFR